MPMKRLLLLPLLAACTSGGPDSSPAAPKEDCKIDCGPHYEDFFDTSKVASLHIQFASNIAAPDKCNALCVDDPAMAQNCCRPRDPAWLHYLWTKWAHCPGGEFVPAEVRYESPDGRGDVTMQNVGVRLRGSKSRGANAIQGLKLDFDIAPDERDVNGGKRRFADLNRMNLLSIEGAGVKNKEATLMIQCAAYEMMRSWGVPAPRCNHLKVYVNGKLYGVMQNAEVVADGRYLQHGFEDGDGTLYEASSGCPPYRDSKGQLQYEDTANGKFVWPYSPVGAPATAPPEQAAQSISALDAQYEVIEYEDTPSGEGGQGGQGGMEIPAEKPADMSRHEWSVVSHPAKSAHAEAELIPMLKCGDETTTPDEAEFKACIQEWLDLDEWLKTLAGESVMPTLESFMVMRNYYLYFEPDEAAPHGGRFKLWSWDFDTVFNRQACYPSDCNPFTAVAGWYVPNPRAKLALRLQSAFKAEYCEALNRFVTEVYTPDLIDRTEQVLEPAVDLIKGGYINNKGQPVVTPEEWHTAVDGVRQYIIERKAQVQGQIDAACN
jgi:hypothetical protein